MLKVFQKKICDVVKSYYKYLQLQPAAILELDQSRLLPENLTILLKCLFLEHFWKVFLPIIVQYNISIPPENVRKPMVFWRFQGVYKHLLNTFGIPPLQHCSTAVPSSISFFKIELEYYLQTKVLWNKVCIISSIFSSFLESEETQLF